VRGALHIHICVCALDSAGLQYLLDNFQRYWRHLLLDLSAAEGIDLFQKNEKFTWIADESKPRCDAGWLRKCPARYLAKYAGKEAREVQDKARYYPSSWISVDAKTRKEAIAERVRLILSGVSVDTARKIFDQAIEEAAGLAENFWCYGSPCFAEDKTEIIELSQDNFLRYWQLVEGLLRRSIGICSQVEGV